MRHLSRLVWSPFLPPGRGRRGTKIKSLDLGPFPQTAAASPLLSSQEEGRGGHRSLGETPKILNKMNSLLLGAPNNKAKVHMCQLVLHWHYVGPLPVQPKLSYAQVRTLRTLNTGPIWTTTWPKAWIYRVYIFMLWTTYSVNLRFMLSRPNNHYNH